MADRTPSKYQAALIGVLFVAVTTVTASVAVAGVTACDSATSLTFVDQHAGAGSLTPAKTFAVERKGAPNAGFFVAVVATGTVDWQLKDAASGVTFAAGTATEDVPSTHFSTPAPGPDTCLEITNADDVLVGFAYALEVVG